MIGSASLQRKLFLSMIEAGTRRKSKYVSQIRNSINEAAAVIIISGLEQPQKAQYWSPRTPPSPADLLWWIRIDCRQLWQLLSAHSMAHVHIILCILLDWIGKARNIGTPCFEIRGYARHNNRDTCSFNGCSSGAFKRSLLFCNDNKIVQA